MRGNPVMYGQPQMINHMVELRTVTKAAADGHLQLHSADDTTITWL